MRTTLQLADDVYEAALTLARASSRSLGEVLSDLARRGLRPVEAAQGAPDDLPIVRMEPGDEVIPGSRASDLLSEEGID